MLYDVLIVDGSNIAYKAYSIHKAMAVQSGKLEGFGTGLMFGFIDTLMAIKKSYLRRDSKIFVAWDRGHKRRSEIYPGYKATRGSKRDEEDYARFVEQRSALRRLLPNLGIFQASMEGEEADDLIGSIAVDQVLKNKKVLIVSGDHDFYQLIKDDIHLFSHKGQKNNKIYNPEEFRKEFGIYPEDYIDVMSIMGDDGDDVPGIDGIGEKTALKIVQENPGLVARILSGSSFTVNGEYRKIKGKTVPEILNESVERIKLAHSLVKIKVDLDPREFLDSPVKNMDSVRDKFIQWGFKEYQRPHNWEILESLG